MKTMKENIVTIFDQLQEYGKAARKFKDENPGQGAPSILNEEIKTSGIRILAAMKEVNQELTAKDGPMNGLCCPVDLDPKTGLGQGRAKDSNGFYLTWAMGAPVVEGVRLSCYVAMNFILRGQRTNESKINIGCGFWVNTPSNGKYSERIKAIGSKQFLEFRHKFNYPLQDGKFVKNDCPLDKDLVHQFLAGRPARWKGPSFHNDKVSAPWA